MNEFPPPPADPLFDVDESIFQRLDSAISLRQEFPVPPTIPPIAENGVAAVEVLGLTKCYGDQLAVDNLNLRVQRGEFFGFLGPNGAGKSTTIKILSGLMLPTSGSAYVAGVDVLRDPLEVKRRIGILPEEIYTYERLSGYELLEFVGNLYEMDAGAIRSRSIDLFRVLDFTPEEASKLIVDYSMGMKKKIALASALIHNPEVLFLDEPFNGIDAVTSRSIRHILQSAVRSGITVFFSSHILEVVERLCSRLAIINNGRLVALGTLDEIRHALSASGDAGLDDLFVQLVAGTQKVEELDWLKVDGQE
jgi:ABC-2 type transport system ATP-binding protein